MAALIPLARRSTHRPFKGAAADWAPAEAPDEPVAWSYPAPFPEVATVAGHFAFQQDEVNVRIGGGRTASFLSKAAFGGSIACFKARAFRAAVAGWGAWQPGHVQRSGARRRSAMPVASTHAQVNAAAAAAAREDGRMLGLGQGLTRHDHAAEDRVVEQPPERVHIGIRGRVELAALLQSGR